MVLLKFSKTKAVVAAFQREGDAFLRCRSLYLVSGYVQEGDCGQSLAGRGEEVRLLQQGHQRRAHLHNIVKYF